MLSATVQVPATSANLGAGFDSLGVALKLYNRVTVRFASRQVQDPFIAEAAEMFFEEAGMQPAKVSVKIEGDVPRSRGLGSSVTVRLGFLCALNYLVDQPLKNRCLLDITAGLEGHPDNAYPAYFGGFCACNRSGHIRVPVSPKLKFIAAIPDMRLETKKAREVLPDRVSRKGAIANVQNTAVVTGAFCTGEYEKLRDAFDDCLHQPYRAELIPGFEDVMHSAINAGALGAYLSGAGSTLMALTLGDPAPIASQMLAALEAHGHEKSSIKVLSADNTGVKRVSGARHHED